MYTAFVSKSFFLAVRRNNLHLKINMYKLKNWYSNFVHGVWFNNFNIFISWTIICKPFSLKVLFEEKDVSLNISFILKLLEALFFYKKYSV